MAGSLKTESYNTFTVHFIDDKYQLQSLVLDTKMSKLAHTGETLKEEIEGSLKRSGQMIYFGAKLLWQWELGTIYATGRDSISSGPTIITL
jgi:hypothetical protein